MLIEVGKRAVSWNAVTDAPHQSFDRQERVFADLA